MEQYRDEIRRVMIAVNVIGGIYAIGAKRVGIKENTLTLLYALDDGKPYSQREISRQWLIPKTTVNTVVRECVQAGYIVLESSGRRREKMIRITGKGRQYASAILGPVYEVEGRAMLRTLEAFSPGFIEAVERFAKNLREENDRLAMEMD